jgi:hypothetical protein
MSADVARPISLISPFGRIWIGVSSSLLRSFSEGGLPCTVGDLRERFDRYVANLIKGKDASKVRIVIE